MRARAVIGLSIVAASLGAGLVACFDLFHSTAGILTACELDAQACGDAGIDGATGFCAWAPSDARAHAAHACAWLGACETPMGGNAFGPCMFSAELAYDCEANPSHPPRGEEHDLWDCLWQVHSCADVDRCVFPSGVPSCPAVAATSCASVDGTGGNRDVRVECTDAGVTHGENCGLRGQTCAAGGGVGACAGAPASAGGLTCSPRLGCTGTQLHHCAGNSDVGIDCASNGAGACEGLLPTAGQAAWVACAATGAQDGGCTPDASAQCSNGVATSCRSGVTETIDCTELLQVDNACSSDIVGPAFDWTSPCAVVPPMCNSDSCSGSTVTSCARGAPFFTDCLAQDLGACHMVTTDLGTQSHAACAPPSSP